MANKVTVTYGIEGEDYELQTYPCDNLIGYAELCAADYYENYGGNCDIDWTWPLEIELKINGENKGTFKVELEWDPCFSAYKMEKENGK